MPASLITVLECFIIFLIVARHLSSYSVIYHLMRLCASSARHPARHPTQTALPSLKCLHVQILAQVEHSLFVSLPNSNKKSNFDSRWLIKCRRNGKSSRTNRAWTAPLVYHRRFRKETWNWKPRNRNLLLRRRGRLVLLGRVRETQSRKKSRRRTTTKKRNSRPKDRHGRRQRSKRKRLKQTETNLLLSQNLRRRNARPKKRRKQKPCRWQLARSDTSSLSEHMYLALEVSTFSVHSCIALIAYTTVPQPPEYSLSAPLHCLD